jgi:predicted enzyme related to lactoylglutathione lyase
MEVNKMIQQMNFLGLVVKDVTSATEFYTQKLGLPVNEEASIPNVYTQFALDGDTIVGLLEGFEQAGVSQSFDAALAVNDPDTYYAKLRAAGVETIGEPHDMPFGRTFLFRTPDGHVLRVYSPPAAS